MNSEITIRSIQHFLYCKHRWGLLEIDRAWAENYFVTRANLLHERVHDFNQYKSRNKSVFTSVFVYNDDYGIYGVTDCIEAVVSENGVSINEDNLKYSLCIVEYKPTKPENKNYNEDDMMQLFAQKICVDYIFGGNCKTVLYYADKKERVNIDFSERFEEYDKQLKAILNTMREYIKKGIVPPFEKGQKCSGCSLKNICMPSSRKLKGLHETILKELEE